MKTHSLLPAGAALLALSGCNFAPHYEPPVAAASAAAFFKEAAPAAGSPAPAWKPADPRDGELRSDWWTAFGDPELSALEDRVAVSNQTVAEAEANTRLARSLLQEATASLFPAISLDPSAIRSKASASASSSASSGGSAASGPGAASGTSSASNTGTRTVYALPIEASYELDFWGRVRNEVAESRAAAEASAADVETALLSTRSQLAQAYFQLRSVDEERRILDTTLSDYKTSLRLVQALYKDGLASDEDLAEAETQLDSAEVQATDLGVARGQYEHAIAVLVGTAPSQFSIPVRHFDPAVPPIPVGLPSDLLERRPDIASAERQVASANAEIGIARSAFFPNVTLGATLGYEATNSANLLSWPNRYWSVGPSLVQPLFEGGALRAVTAQAWATYDASVASYRQTVLSALQSVEDNLLSLRVLSLEAAQAHRAAASAEREVELSTTRYKLGLDSYVNVIAAQNTYLTNREAELQVQVRRIIASIELIANLGGGWDRSRLGDAAKTAMHPPAPGPAAPAESVPNPPVLPNQLNPPAM
jgi:NodT family efflux transporter outer membrane factor (OMF) lipoprotein